jgi:hypothetical protein
LSASPDVLVGAMHLVSGVSGLKAADMAAVAVLFPETKGVAPAPAISSPCSRPPAHRPKPFHQALS